jgi:uncharacterized membrane protein
MKEHRRRFITCEFGSIAGLIFAFLAASALNLSTKPNWLSLVILTVMGTILGNIVNYIRYKNT